MIFRVTNCPAILHHALRAALVLLCLSVAIGNSLAALMLNLQATLASQVILTEEMPTEEAPVETELPTELIELSEFTAPKGGETHRRRIVTNVRGFLYVEPCCRRYDSRTAQHAGISIMQLRNGCGAALRC